MTITYYKRILQNKFKSVLLESVIEAEVGAEKEKSNIKVDAEKEISAIKVGAEKEKSTIKEEAAKRQNLLEIAIKLKNNEMLKLKGKLDVRGMIEDIILSFRCLLLDG